MYLSFNATHNPKGVLPADLKAGRKPISGMTIAMDRAVGTVLDALDRNHLTENTLVVFLSDNGGQTGHTNSPLRGFKHDVYEGGIHVPFVLRWPKVIPAGILPTLIDVSGGTYPADFGGKKHPPLPGRSFGSILKNGEKLPERTQHFALFNNMALIDHGWKIVTAYGQPWQLYDLAKDRTEMRDLAESQPEKLSELLSLQRSFFQREDVRLRTSGGEREPEYAAIYKADGKIGPGARENVNDEAFSLALAKAQAEGRQLSTAEREQLKQQTSAKPAQGRGKKRKKNE